MRWEEMDEYLAEKGDRKKYTTEKNGSLLRTARNPCILHTLVNE
jgi:hypothetical protein